MYSATATRTNGYVESGAAKKAAQKVTPLSYINDCLFGGYRVTIGENDLYIDPAITVQRFDKDIRDGVKTTLTSFGLPLSR